MKKSHVMSDATWKRHANPWSVWTRFATLPFLALAIWSRTWIGMWSLLPIALLCFWLWLNPRAFPAPKTTKTWASKATFGERVLLNKKQIPIPKHHLIASGILSGIAGLGAFIAIYGLVILSIWLTILGVALVYLGKMWFLDRMVWLYEDMKDSSEQYKSWEY